jgi:hypothetical protein
MATLKVLTTISNAIPMAVRQWSLADCLFPVSSIRKLAMLLPLQLQEVGDGWQTQD